MYCLPVMLVVADEWYSQWEHNPPPSSISGAWPDAVVQGWGFWGRSPRQIQGCWGGKALHQIGDRRGAVGNAVGWLSNVLDYPNGLRTQTAAASMQLYL